MLRLLSKCLNVFIPVEECTQEIRTDAFGGENNINSINGSVGRQIPAGVGVGHQKVGKFMST